MELDMFLHHGADPVAFRLGVVEHLGWDRATQMSWRVSGYVREQHRPVWSSPIL